MPNLFHILAADQNAIDKFFLPIPASNLSHDVDWAWNFVLGISVFFFCLVVGAMIYFVVKYRRRTRTDQTSTITHNTPLEIIWTGVPLIIVLIVFFIGFKGFINYDTPASNAVAIDVQTRKWAFSFNYPNGGTDSNLHLLKGVPVVLNLQSADVLHAVFIPAFRTQRNAVPGRTTQIWFIPEVASPMPLGDSKGGFELYCTQYCGEQHSLMRARVYVYDNKEEYDKKMVELANPFKEEDKNGVKHWIPFVKVGKKMFDTYCSQCHTDDDTTKTAPKWKGLWKRSEKFAYSNDPGFTIAATDTDEKWEKYLTESMLHPEFKLVEGYGPIMPSFAGQFEGSAVKEDKIHAIIEYMKSIGTEKYEPKISPEKNPELFLADDKHPTHPESRAKPATSSTEPAKQ